MNLTANFTREELACKHCGQMHIPLAAVEKLQKVRDRFGPVTVSSGYRCPVYNQQKSTTGEAGPHTKAAFDIAISGPPAFTLMAIALQEGFTGIGVHQRGPHAERFIHLDALDDEPGQPRPAIWSY